MEIQRPDGVTIVVHEDGPAEAPPVLFVHGVTLSADEWGWLVPRLSATHRVLRIDQRGHGDSGRDPDGVYRGTAFVEDVEAVLDEVGPAMVVGHSLGGVVAMAVAQRRPDLVRALLSIDPGLVVADPEVESGAIPIKDLAKVLTLVHQATPQLQASGVDADTLGTQLLDMPGLTGLPAREQYEDGVTHAWASSQLRLDNRVLDTIVDPEAERDPVPFDIDAPIEVPTEVLLADLDAPDSIVTAEQVQALQAAGSPLLAVERITDGAHGFPDERAHRQRFVQRLDRFLARHRVERDWGEMDGEYEPSTSEWVRRQVDTYEATDGREMDTMGDSGLPIVVFTSRGRTTGALRKFALMRVEHEGVYCLVASKGGHDEHPAWFLNLDADPTVQVQDGPFPFVTEVRQLEGDEYDTWWDRAVEAFDRYEQYRRDTDRRIPLLVTE